jgi:type I restriction enzyme S subunit
MKKLVRLGDVAQINPRFDKSSLADDTQVSFVPMAAVGAADGKIDTSTARPFAEVKKGSYTPFKDGDVLFAKVTPCMENGKMAVARDLKNGVGFGSSEFHVLRPSQELDAKYLYYFVSSQSFRKEAAGHMTGAVGLRRVPAAFLADAQLPMVPLDEQRHIVAEIEKQFSRLDEAVANLQRVKANLKRYKASVLKAAVEGRLVETEASIAQREGRSYETGEQLFQRILQERRAKWSGKRKYKEPVKPMIESLSELPEGWAWASTEQVSAGEPYSLAIGPFGSSLKVSDYMTEGVPLVFVRNIRSGVFGGDNTVHVSADKAAELSAHAVEAGDILVTKMGDPPGDVCRYPANRPPAVITADCIKLRLTKLGVDPSFVGYAIASRIVQDQILNITKGVAQLKVNLANFSSIALPLPPLVEQIRIVAEVDRHLSIISEVESEIALNLKRATVLRQTILHSSFSPANARYPAYER